MTFAQQPITETNASNLSHALCSMGIPATFNSTHTRDYLAKVQTANGFVCVYANGKGSTKIGLHEMRAPQATLDTIARAWSQVTAAGARESTPTKGPEPAGIVIYTDGSCVEQGPVHGTGYAFVVLQDGEKVYEQAGQAVIDGSRNVAGEIEAVLQALEACVRNGWTTPLFKHDYEGVDYLATGAWKATKPNSIRYQREVQNYRTRGVRPTFQWVRAHSDTHWNDVVDGMAREAALANQTAAI